MVKTRRDKKGMTRGRSWLNERIAIVRSPLWEMESPRIRWVPGYDRVENLKTKGVRAGGKTRGTNSGTEDVSPAATKKTQPVG